MDAHCRATPCGLVDAWSAYPSTTGTTRAAGPQQRPPLPLLCAWLPGSAEQARLAARSDNVAELAAMQALWAWCDALARRAAEEAKAAVPAGPRHKTADRVSVRGLAPDCDAPEAAPPRPAPWLVALLRGDAARTFAADTDPAGDAKNTSLDQLLQRQAYRALLGEARLARTGPGAFGSCAVLGGGALPESALPPPDARSRRMSDLLRCFRTRGGVRALLEALALRSAAAVAECGGCPDAAPTTPRGRTSHTPRARR